jgi:hypothetical protein
VPIEMMDKINFAKRKVSFSLNVDTIREAPVYVNIEEINDRLYEQEIYDYYKARIPQESH